MHSALVLADVDDGGGVLPQHEVLIDVKVDCLMGGFSDGNYDSLYVLHLHVDGAETVVVLFVYVKDYLVAVSAG